MPPPRCSAGGVTEWGSRVSLRSVCVCASGSAAPPIAPRLLRVISCVRTPWKPGSHYRALVKTRTSFANRTASLLALLASTPTWVLRVSSEPPLLVGSGRRTWGARTWASRCASRPAAPTPSSPVTDHPNLQLPSSSPATLSRSPSPTRSTPVRCPPTGLLVTGSRALPSPAPWTTWRFTVPRCSR